MTDVRNLATLAGHGLVDDTGCRGGVAWGCSSREEKTMSDLDVYLSRLQFRLHTTHVPEAYYRHNGHPYLDTPYGGSFDHRWPTGGRTVASRTDSEVVAIFLSERPGSIGRYLRG